MRHHLWAAFAVMLASLLPLCGANAASQEGPGVLRAEFIYADMLGKSELTKGKCKPPEERSAAAAIAVDVAVGLAGKLAGSLIDAAAAKTQPEAITIEAVAPLDGFYDAKSVAVDKGCLVVHNGTAKDAAGASLKGIFQVEVSPDSTAFRFTVIEWKFERFLRPHTSQWFQDAGTRDFVLKIEFLAPGSEGLGRRAVFVEHAFIAVDRDAMVKAFEPGQKLPWFAAPQPPSGKLTDLSLPLNLRATVVETTKPNQLAVWVRDIANDKKTDVKSLVQDAVRTSLDPNFAATQDAQSATAAGTAYGAYKSAWDTYAAQVAAKPADLPASATAIQRAAYAAALAAWQAGVTVNLQLTEAKKVAARAAFSAASLSWPGDLPPIPI